MRIFSSVFLSFLTLFSLTLRAQTGLDPNRLARIAPFMEQQVKEGKMSGGVGLVIRGGKVAYFESYGYMDRAAGKKMRNDAIFRIYSMTKAVTAVAAMMLWEEGRFGLNDPISKYLPEFAEVSQKAPIRVVDLFRHTSGVIDYSAVLPEFYKAHPDYPVIVDQRIDLAEVSRRIAKIPLLHTPGTTFHYGYSVDVLGRLVEVVSGKTLEQFFDERILKPLGMKDTAFYVPREKWDRLVVLDEPGPDGKVRRSNGYNQDSYKTKPVAFLGGQGLVSTAADYSRFCQMLLNGGEFEGKRYLGRKTIEKMTSDHLGNLARAGASQPGVGTGFGLTFAITMDAAATGMAGSTGEFFWSGAAGTRFWIDPQEDMITIFMVNTLPPLGVEKPFKAMVYSALE